jgi:hypothetical protein
MARLTRQKYKSPCKYIGVHKSKSTGKFKYIITHKGKTIESDYIYKTEENASREYQKVKDKIKKEENDAREDNNTEDELDNDELDNDELDNDDSDKDESEDDKRTNLQNKKEKPKKNIVIHIKKKRKVNKKSFIKKNDTPRQSIPQWMRNSIYSRQNNKCNLCKKSLGVDRPCDHILPRYLGGEDNISNYQVICTECHNWKSYTFDHYLNKLLKKNNKLSIDTIKNIMFKKYSELMGSPLSIYNYQNINPIPNYQPIQQNPFMNYQTIQQNPFLNYPHIAGYPQLSNNYLPIQHYQYMNYDQRINQNNLNHTDYIYNKKYNCNDEYDNRSEESNDSSDSESYSEKDSKSKTEKSNFNIFSFFKFFF